MKLMFAIENQGKYWNTVLGWVEPEQASLYREEDELPQIGNIKLALKIDGDSKVEFI